MTGTELAAVIAAIGSAAAAIIAAIAHQGTRKISKKVDNNTETKTE